MATAGTESYVETGPERQCPDNRSLRSVDRECVGRAIEPRNRRFGSRRARQHGRQHRHVETPSVSTRRGQKERGMCTLGIVRNLGGSVASLPIAAGEGARQPKPRPGGVSDSCLQERTKSREEGYRRARETERQSAGNCVRDRATEVRAPRITREAGKPAPRGACGGKGVSGRKLAEGLALRNHWRERWRELWVLKQSQRNFSG